MKNARIICVYQKIVVLLQAFSCKKHVISINPGKDSRNPRPIKPTKEMATKIRLARYGHKDYAFYHIVVADSQPEHQSCNRNPQFRACVVLGRRRCTAD